MARRILTVAAAAALVAGLAGCGDDGGTADDGATGSSETTAPAVTPVLRITDTPLGTILTDAEGNTVYVFTQDEGATSTCTDGCAATWPPVEVSGAPVAEGVDAPIGTTTRADGSTQLIVDGRPVYTYSGDSGPGDTNGHGVGDVWFVVGADGQPITAAVTPTTALGGRAGGY